MYPSNLCQICGKPLAYALPGGSWYEPPVGPYWTPATSITLTVSAGTSTEGWGEITISALDYCYGHSFVRCADCGCQVPYGFHSPSQCSILRGMMEGIRQVAASVERQETVPADEHIGEMVDVPDVFHEAFKEIEQL